MKDGGPAFAHHVTAGGMTLRDYFAAKAMQGMLASIHPDEEPMIAPIAEDAYRMADAMLAEKNKAA